ncbi:helix-turn-helix domain-containing protein [Thermodesulfobacteriota bacterium]
MGRKKKEQLLSVIELKTYLGVSKDTVYRWLRQRKIPGNKAGKVWTFNRKEVDDWAKKGGSMRKDTIKQVTYDVLQRAKKPLSVPEITDRVLKEIEIHSKTPQNTVNLSLQRHEKIQRVGRGLYKAIR